MLTAEKVSTIFLDCLFRDNEIVDGKPTKEMIPARGITTNVGFCRERIDAHAQEIIDLCNELPEVFREGTSFLAMAEDRNGNQWGEHKSMQELMLLGVAIGKIVIPLPREVWAVLPGGMPYVLVKA